MWVKVTILNQCFSWNYWVCKSCNTFHMILNYILYSFFFSKKSVIDDKTCEERLWKMKHCGETNFYLCEINRDMVIDATYKGNKSRFINHSCQPNTEMQKWLSPILFITCSHSLGQLCLIWCILQDNWWWNSNWYICHAWHKKGRGTDLWLSVCAPFDGFLKKKICYMFVHASHVSQ